MLKKEEKEKCDRSNFIHFFWFTENKSESLGRRATQREEGPLGTETQTACVYGGEGVTHCLTKVSCDIKHGLRPVNTDLRPFQSHSLLPSAPLILHLKCRFGLNTKYLLPTRTERLHTRLH